MARVTIGGRSYEVEVRADAVVVDGHSFAVTVRDEAAYKTVTAGGVAYRVRLPGADARQSGMEIEVDHRPFTLEFEGRLGAGPAPRTARPTGGAAGAPRAGVKGGIAAQIAGKVLSVKVKVGDAVKQGDLLLLLEAMKMENEIKAPADGVVKEVLVEDGSKVTEGDTLVVLE